MKHYSIMSCKVTKLQKHYIVQHGLQVGNTTMCDTKLDDKLEFDTPQKITCRQSGQSKVDSRY